MPLSIRASSLQNYLDCGRRGAASLFADEIKEEGYRFKPSPKSAGSVLGSMIHIGAAEVLKQVKQFGYLDREQIHVASEMTINRLDEEFAKGGVIWDQTTKDEYAARVQMRRMVSALVPVLQVSEPLYIEHSLEATVSPLGKQAQPITITGTLDELDVSKLLSDHKTGAKTPSAHAQLGLYTILCQLNDIEVLGTRLNFVKRCAVNKEQEPCRVIRFDTEQCVSAAWAILKRIQRDYEEWCETKDPWSFTANSQSMICTPKYCKCFNTPFCKVGVEVKGKPDN